MTGMRPSASPITFVFSDIVGSTRLWEADPGAMSVALSRHDVIVRRAVESAGGRVFKTVGDAFCAAFGDAVSAVAGAVDVQRALAAESWPPAMTIRVRIGVHSGLCEERDSDYFGTAVNRVARLESIAHGGQVLLSGATAELVRDLLPGGCSLLDLGEHRLKDLSQPEHVFQVSAEGLESDFPPLRSLDNPALRHNLPEQVSSFVGRDGEVAVVRGLLGESRVVTLAGPGGVGKTRLAIHVASELLDGSGAGVWIVELAPIQDPALVGPAVAGVLGVADQPGRPALAALVDSVRDRELLLVLDNCEHVLEAAAVVAAELVRRCPRLFVLATSREPLRIPGEQVHRVPSLEVPPADVELIEQIADSSAVRLFVERATEQNPAFRVTADNASIVASVVRRLDGIPLAIELAAARLRVLSIHDLAARLDQRFRLLTGGARTTLPRQRTLEAMVEWSYDLLSPSEQAAFERVSVFAGGFDLEAAEELCAPVLDEDPLDVVTALVDKSLIQLDDRRGVRRYSLLETVREYAAARLADQGPETLGALRRSHLEHYLALAEEGEHKIRGPEQMTWLLRFEMEHDNFRLALATCLDEGDADAGLRLAVALSPFRAARGHARESLAALDAQLALPGAEAPTLARGCALAAWSRVSHDYVQAIDRTTEALSIARGYGDDSLTANALRGLSDLAHRQGRYADAVRLADEGLEVARRVGDDLILGMLHRGRGIALLSLGEDPTPDTAAALECFRRSGDLIQVATTLGNVGVNEFAAGNLTAARPHLAESLRLARELDNPRHIVVMTINLGLLDHLKGDDPSARRLLLEALEGADRLRDWECVLYALCDVALTESSSGDSEEAVRLHGTVDELADVLGERFEAMEEGLRVADQNSLRAQLGTERFNALLSEGRTRSLDTVIDALLGAGTANVRVA